MTYDILLCTLEYSSTVHCTQQGTMYGVPVTPYSVAPCHRVSFHVGQSYEYMYVCSHLCSHTLYVLVLVLPVVCIVYYSHIPYPVWSCINSILQYSFTTVSTSHLYQYQYLIPVVFHRSMQTLNPLVGMNIQVELLLEPCLVYLYSFHFMSASHMNRMYGYAHTFVHIHCTYWY